MVLGQVLRELVMGEVLAGDDAADDMGMLERCEVAIRRRLRKRTIGIEDLRDRHRLRRRGDDGDERTPFRGVALVHPSEPSADLDVQVALHRPSVAAPGISENHLVVADGRRIQDMRALGANATTAYTLTAVAMIAKLGGTRAIT
jgi:hypothetical protein